MTLNTQTKEPQYKRQIDLIKNRGPERLGLTTNQLWYDDPKHLLFTLSRYKFVGKMLRGEESVLEIGCGDAFGARIVQQEVKLLFAIDFDPVFVEDVKGRMIEKWKFECEVHDILAGPLSKKFSAAYSLDVIEHIRPSDECAYMQNIVKSLEADGVFIIGTPSLYSQSYASSPSRAGHINCKTHEQLDCLMKKYYQKVFLFSMNDEVLHTGFYPMSHYIFALGSIPR